MLFYSRAYRSIYASEQIKNLSLVWWVSPDTENPTTFTTERTIGPETSTVEFTTAVTTPEQTTSNGYVTSIVSEAQTTTKPEPTEETTVVTSAGTTEAFVPTVTDPQYKLVACFHDCIDHYGCEAFPLGWVYPKRAYPRVSVSNLE